MHDSSGFDGGIPDHSHGQDSHIQHGNEWNAEPHQQQQFSHPLPQHDALHAVPPLHDPAQDSKPVFFHPAQVDVVPDMPLAVPVDYTAPVHSVARDIPAEARPNATTASHVAKASITPAAAPKVAAAEEFMGPPAPPMSAATAATEALSAVANESTKTPIPPAVEAAAAEKVENTAADALKKNEGKFTGLLKKTFSGKKGLAIAAGAVVVLGAMMIGVAKKPEEQGAGASR